LQSLDFLNCCDDLSDIFFLEGAPKQRIIMCK